MISIDDWVKDLLARRSAVLTGEFRVAGIREAHIGPKLESALIEFAICPSQSLGVTVDPPYDAPEFDAYVHAGVFGLLDVLLVADPLPVRNIAVRIVKLGIHPINSSIIAFRRAGRDAGNKLLLTLRP